MVFNLVCIFFFFMGPFFQIFFHKGPASCIYEFTLEYTGQVYNSKFWCSWEQRVSVVTSRRQLQWTGVDALEARAPRRSAATFSSHLISSSSTGPVRTVWSRTHDSWMLGTNRSLNQPRKTRRSCAIFAGWVSGHRDGQCIPLPIRFHIDYWPFAVSWSPVFFPLVVVRSCISDFTHCISAHCTWRPQRVK